jgi:RNA polymerase sigma-70 factor, ECF subfamily
VAKASDSFASAYDEYVWEVYGFFGYRLRSREEAEDLTQATFERAFKAWHRFDPERASAKTWLLAIARNLLIDHYRKPSSTPNVPLDDEEGSEPAAEELDPGESLGLDPDLEAALATLRPRERELIALRFGGDLNGPEIAELTGLTLANVQQILSRALRRMRAELEGSATPESPGGV